jgi:hypothetical protein
LATNHQVEPKIKRQPRGNRIGNNNMTRLMENKRKLQETVTQTSRIHAHLNADQMVNPKAHNTTPAKKQTHVHETENMNHTLNISNM